MPTRRALIAATPLLLTGCSGGASPYDRAVRDLWRLPDLGGGEVPMIALVRAATLAAWGLDVTFDRVDLGMIFLAAVLAVGVAHGGVTSCSSRASACWSARIARIRISTTAPNNNEKPSVEASSPHRNSGAISLLPIDRLGGWCSEFHHSTE